MRSRLVLVASVCGGVSVAGCAFEPGPADDGDCSGCPDDGGEPEWEWWATACHQYEPGESGGPSFEPLLSKADLNRLNFTIAYPDAPIAALQASALYAASDSELRLVFGGLVDVDERRTSKPFDFKDVPLSGMGPSNFRTFVDDQERAPHRVTCSSDPSTPLSVVFLVDVTGSMGEVISAVRDSLLAFVDAAVEMGVQGNVGIVTYQDTVGVDIPFEDCSAVTGLIPERSPFFAPVPFSDATAVGELRGFISQLHADGGADLPENLAAAVDFAANNVIGYDALGAPNVIGAGGDDPPRTSPWPAESLAGLIVFVAITDITFHGDAEASESLVPAFKPRRIPEILQSLGGALVGIIDPMVVDENTGASPARASHDADLWARYTGGFGEDDRDLTLGFDGFTWREDMSLFDLDLLVAADGLQGIPLAPFLASTCTLAFAMDEPPASVRTVISHGDDEVTSTLAPRLIQF